MTHGILYVVSTPIGNLEDLTPRARRILGEVDLILAEDTRRTGLLLHHLGIQTSMRSLHRHNERAREEEALARLGEGGHLALVSDAGTPLVSDPGEGLVGRVLEAGHTVVPIPGASAVLAALVASGIPAVPFTFFGFLPRKGRERERLLREIGATPHTVVLFESPERTGRLLATLAEGEGAGDRQAAVIRELTKLHEEVRRGTVAELAGYYQEVTPRGEVTVVLGPGLVASDPAVTEASLEAEARTLLAEGLSPSRAARALAQRLGIPKNRAYDLVQAVSSSAPPTSPELPNPAS